MSMRTILDDRQGVIFNCIRKYIPNVESSRLMYSDGIVMCGSIVVAAIRRITWDELQIKVYKNEMDDHINKCIYYHKAYSNFEVTTNLFIEGLIDVFRGKCIDKNLLNTIFLKIEEYKENGVNVVYTNAYSETCKGITAIVKSSRLISKTTAVNAPVAVNAPAAVVTPATPAAVTPIVSNQVSAPEFIGLSKPTEDNDSDNDDDNDSDNIIQESNNQEEEPLKPEFIGLSKPTEVGESYNDSDDILQNLINQVDEPEPEPTINNDYIPLLKSCLIESTPDDNAFHYLISLYSLSDILNNENVKKAKFNKKAIGARYITKLRDTLEKDKVLQKKLLSVVGITDVEADELLNRLSFGVILKQNTDNNINYLNMIHKIN